MEARTHLEMSALIRNHGQGLQQFLTRRLGCTETAKDLVQDTLLRTPRATIDITAWWHNIHNQC